MWHAYPGPGTRAGDRVPPTLVWLRAVLLVTEAALSEPRSEGTGVAPALACRANPLAVRPDFPLAPAALSAAALAAALAAIRIASSCGVVRRCAGGVLVDGLPAAAAVTAAAAASARASVCFITLICWAGVMTTPALVTKLSCVGGPLGPGG